MSASTHVACWDCWREMAAAAGKPNRQPMQVIGSREEPCCFCGDQTAAGIFVGRDPMSPELVCRGSDRHQRDALTADEVTGVTPPRPSGR